MSTSDGPTDPAAADGSNNAGSGAGVSGSREERVWRRRLGEMIAEIGRKGEQTADQVGRVAQQVVDVIHEVSRLSPRVDDLDTSVAALASALEAHGAGDGDDPALELTPATRWSQLSRQDKHAAWDALGGWVAEVLTPDYRLTRVELPDCWPAHPRAVRELAWLRTLHIATTATGVRPEIVAEWHTRWLPGAITNIAMTVDPRECAPGRHRLTEHERRQHEIALEDAAREGRMAPELTDERGPDRPRYLPERFPPRRNDDALFAPGGPTRPSSLDAATPPPPSTPDDWREYFLDARLADIGDGLND